MAKPVIKFKTYRQSQRVGGKIYGVPNLGDPVVASVTMQEVIDYAKLHNYSADTLEALLSQVIAGVGDLVARDGRPRMLSDLLKFEPVIKGTFDNLEQTITNQKVLVRPRMLKEIKVLLDASDYAWQNQNDKESPRIFSVAPDNQAWDTVTLESFIASLQNPGGFGWSVAGSKLCPNGWDAACDCDVIYRPRGGAYAGKDVHLIYIQSMENEAGTYFKPGDIGGDPVATDNTFVMPFADGSASLSNAGWVLEGSNPSPVLRTALAPVAGDELEFIFSRVTSAGDKFTVSKKYDL